jgi:hypothetical protein
MVDIVALPVIRNVLCEGDNIGNFIAGATIIAGQVVAYAAAGASMTVHPAVNATTAMPIGVALEGATVGQTLAVAMNGCICNVVNGDDTLDIDAGDIVEPSANVLGGCVQTAVLVEAGVVLVVKYQCGIMLDIVVGATVGGGYGRMLVSCGIFTSINNA